MFVDMSDAALPFNEAPYQWWSPGRQDHLRVQARVRVRVRARCPGTVPHVNPTPSMTLWGPHIQCVLPGHHVSGCLLWYVVTHWPCQCLIKWWALTAGRRTDLWDCTVPLRRSPETCSSGLRGVSLAVCHVLLRLDRDARLLKYQVTFWEVTL